MSVAFAMKISKCVYGKVVGKISQRVWKIYKFPILLTIKNLRYNSMVLTDVTWK
jgi:hypothetical protein